MCLIFCFHLTAQIDGSSKTKSTDKLNDAAKERKKLNKAFSELGSSFDRDSYNTAQRILKKTRYKNSKIFASIILGTYYNEHDISDSAIYYSKKALTLVENKKDSISIHFLSNIYNILGNAYGDKNLLEEAKKWHFKGLEISKNKLPKIRYYEKQANLASLYIRLGDYDYAINLLKDCLNQNFNPRFNLIVRINLANAYSRKNDFKNALSYLENALSHLKKGKDEGIRVVITQNIGAQYHEMKQYDKALAYYQQARDLGVEKGYHRPAIDAMTNIGLLYQDQMFYEKAKKTYIEILEQCKKFGFFDKQIVIYENLEECSIKQNNHKDAYNYFLAKTKIKDSIRNLQKDREIQELEVRFNTKEKEKEIKLLKAENLNAELELKHQEEAIKNLTLRQRIEEKETQNQILAFQNTSEKRLNEIILLRKDQELQITKTEQQRQTKNIILVSALILLVPIIALLFVYYQKSQTQKKLNQSQEKINEQKIASIKKDQELALIKATMEGQNKERLRIAQELHDGIGGNLAAIKLQLSNYENNITHHQIAHINLQIDDTYQQVRDLSHNLIPKKIKKNKFSQILDEYLSRISEASNLSVNFTAYPKKEINLLDQNLKVEIFKIVQELTTNTIKHANASNISLQVNKIENNLSLFFEDDGIGFDTSKEKEGIGLNNIKNRLQKISGNLHIDSRKNRGTIINIEITNLLPKNAVQPNHN